MEEQRPSFPKSKIRENKLQVLQEKIKERADAKSKSEETQQADDYPSHLADIDEEMIASEGPSETDESELIVSPPVPKRVKSNETDDDADISQCPELDDDEEQSFPTSSSPIETELDISLAAAAEENLDSFILGSPLSTDDSANKIPGLGLDPRDHQPGTSSNIVVKKDRSSKREKKQKSLVYKKSPKIVVSEKSKEIFRGKIAHVVIAHLNPYRKPDVKSGRIISTEDFKHLARKVSFAHTFFFL